MAGEIDRVQVYYVTERPCDGCWRPLSLYLIADGDHVHVEITDSNGVPSAIEITPLSIVDAGNFDASLTDTSNLDGGFY